MLDILVNRPWLFVNLNMRGRFTIILTSMVGWFQSVNPNWHLRRIKTDRANSGGACTIPLGKRLSYCYIDQNGKFIFRKKPELVSLASETDKTNSEGVSTILPAATHSICTSRTDDGTAALHASLPHITVLSDSPKSSSMVPMPKVSCDASQTDSQIY